MKLIIFLLLLSGSCAGQECPPIPDRLCFPKFDPCEGQIGYSNPPQLIGKHEKNCIHRNSIRNRKSLDSLKSYGSHIINGDEIIESGGSHSILANVKINPFGGSAIYVEHEHKWVDLHQDTVDVAIYNYGTDCRFDLFKDRYEESIPLICLICHHEKKKVFHYKRDK